MVIKKRAQYSQFYEGILSSVLTINRRMVNSENMNILDCMMAKVLRLLLPIVNLSKEVLCTQEH